MEIQRKPNEFWTNVLVHQLIENGFDIAQLEPYALKSKDKEFPSIEDEVVEYECKLKKGFIRYFTELNDRKDNRDGFISISRALNIDVLASAQNYWDLNENSGLFQERVWINELGGPNLHFHFMKEGPVIIPGRDVGFSRLKKYVPGEQYNPQRCVKDIVHYAIDNFKKGK